MAEKDVPPRKKRRISLSLKNNRFGSPTKQKELEKASEGVVPENTKCNTHWALKTFLSWVNERNTRVSKVEEAVDPEV